MKKLFLFAAMAFMPILVSAQNTPEVSVSVGAIVGDARMAPDVRIKRSLALLQERSTVEREQGNAVAADRLQQSLTYLLQAPTNAEAAELAAQAAEAAGAGDSETALVLAESAAELAGANEALEPPVLE